MRIIVLLYMALHVSALSARAQLPEYQQPPIMLKSADFCRDAPEGVWQDCRPSGKRRTGEQVSRHLFRRRASIESTEAVLIYPGAGGAEQYREDL